MNDDELREKIASFIQNRAGAVANDATTFYWARTMHVKDFQDRALGGGNFLIGASSFLILNYLAKIYWLINGGSPSTSEEEIAVAKRAIKESGLPKRVRDMITLPRPGQINEFDAFRQFILALNREEVCDFGIPDERQDMQKLYDDWRNRLVHMLDIINGTAITWMAPPDTASGRKRRRWISRLNDLVSRETPAFVGDPSHWDCNVDELNGDIKLAISWLVKYVRETKTLTTTALRATVLWLTKN